MSEKTKLKITTITPVTIGSGVELSPYCDYVIERNQICFIDKKKMAEKILEKGEEYFNKYVYGVANGMEINGNNRSEFELKNFLLNNKIVQNIDEIVFSHCDLTGDKSKKLPVKGLLKTPLQEPYFAGSSIKGALKTVLMYNWLKTNNNAGSKIEEIINGTTDFNGRPKNVSFDWLEKKFEINILTGQGKNTIVQVTDSKMLPKDSNVVVDCFRKIPIRLECIAKDISTEFELTLENYQWEDLAKQANDYAFDCLNRELDLAEKNENLTAYFNQSVDIQDLVNDELGKNNSSVAYLRVGFGKGYYLNSLGIAVYDYVSQNGRRNLYDKFESFLKKESAKRGGENEFSLEEFPRTRLMVKETQEPLGWIKIEKI